jgi:hypothetical protein
VETLEGRFTTLSAFMKADATRAVGVRLEQNFGTGGSPSGSVGTTAPARNLSTSWQRLAYAVTMPSTSGKTIGSNNDDCVGVLFSLPLNTAFTIDVCMPQWEAGRVDTAPDLRPPYSEESYFHPVAAIGYSPGLNLGGTVTQATSKSTGVTLNALSGQITMNKAALAAGTILSFVLTDNFIAAGDVLIINHISGGTPGSYSVNARCAAGSATIDVRNNTAGALGEAIVVAFAVVKAPTT